MIPEPRERAKRMKSPAYGSRAQFSTQLLDACDELRLCGRPVTIITSRDKQWISVLGIYCQLIFIFFTSFTQISCILLSLL